MANFPRLQELAAAGNSNNLTDAVSVYIQREINADLQFAVGLSQMWDVLYNKVNEMRMMSSELNLFGRPLAVQCAEYVGVKDVGAKEDDIESAHLSA
ncbi:hypothetical protein Tco_0649033 [Tanacetum coccineum]